MSAPTPRPGVAAIPRYAPPRAHDAVDLADSTNAWGAAPSAVTAAARAATEAWRYPSLYGEPLKAALAELHGVDPSCIVTGCGSDDVLRSSFSAFGAPGDVITWMDPTFVIIASFAKLLGLDARPVPFDAALRFDGDALVARQAAITYLCSPNNPTGTLVEADALRDVIARARGLVVLDEAYADFSGASLIAEAPSRANLLVTRTFSKSFGLAGLRVGYGVATPAIVEAIERARGPYTLNRVAEQAATAVVMHDVPWMRARAADAIAARDRLATELRALGFAPLPSAANFLCVPTPRAAALAAACLARGVVIRAFSGLPAVGDAVRIAAAPWEVLARVVDAAREVGA